ncbi:glycine betaine ABC transporter substrate-binding protein [Acetobacter farinalis]|uniref:Glycine betaine ABC transporter substrate-binding protein n=1 Tax=Acetobacter farinalis TaxID=1260984 RepID=A0ABT3Q564_9PROT|nr:glycine betaine ABC transporter substrate-binding protein [Acetobacter farinalis]MCX2560371.1 glycine betaine ABC transporter substrate-binding protein [Acetobacter farinalis]NHO29026.1 glycine/betaine ABC transporter substrate-binding protein [Acetobacter farinalis]
MTTITLAHPDSTVHEATAAAIIRVLEAHDVEPEIVIGPKAALADMLKNGEVDLYISAWLPEDDADLLAPGVTPLGRLFNPGAYCCISREDGPVVSLNDVAQAGPELSRTIITPASLRTRVEQMMADYALAEAGFTLAVMPDEEALAALTTALNAKECILMPLVQPCFLFHQGGFRILSDPKGSMGKEQEARMLMRPGLTEDMDQDLQDELDELMLSTKVISAMDFAMRTEGLTAEEAAESWQRGKLLPR